MPGEMNPSEAARQASIISEQICKEIAALHEMREKEGLGGRAVRAIGGLFTRDSEAKNGIRITLQTELHKILSNIETFSKKTDITTDLEESYRGYFLEIRTAVEKAEVAYRGVEKAASPFSQLLTENLNRLNVLNENLIPPPRRMCIIC